MALTITLLNDGKISTGGKIAVLATVAFDSSYPTGGEAIAASDLGLSTIDVLIPNQRNGHIIEWDKTNAKLLVYRQSDIGSTVSIAATPFSEASNAIDLSSITGVDIIAWGT